MVSIKSATEVIDQAEQIAVIFKPRISSCSTRSISEALHHYMKRRTFLMSIPPTVATISSLSSLAALGQLADSGKPTPRMPVLFLGHGSPMNAIEENEFVRNFRAIAQKLPQPKAVLCISAHWETRGTKVCAVEQPKTIHDFGGFPKALFDVQYPAPGSPELAKLTVETAKSPITLDHEWGLDHGAWSVLKHLFPKANIPVVQLSLDYTKNAAAHYALAQELAALRNKGILIVSSGNMVHNLGRIALPPGASMGPDAFNKPYALDWAKEAHEQMMAFVRKGDHKALIGYEKQGKAWSLAIPTPEHYLPLLYTLALTDGKDQLSTFNDVAVAGSLTMTSLAYGV